MRVGTIGRMSCGVQGLKESFNAVTYSNFKIYNQAFSEYKKKKNL